MENDGWADMTAELKERGDIWERKAHALQVALEEIAGIISKNVTKGYEIEQNAGDYHSFALGQITGVVSMHVKHPWDRFSE